MLTTRYSHLLKIIFSCLFGCIILIGKTQVYHPFEKDSAVWGIIATDYFPFPEVSTIYYYETDGDTIIGGEINRKLFRIFTDASGYFIDKVYWGGISEDTSKKVYFIRDSETESRLMYDFGMNIKDTATITAYAFWPDGIQFILDTIYEQVINLAGEVRKYYFLSSTETSYGDVWIEGIGSEYGLFELPWLATFGYRLGCYKENDISLLGTGGCNVPTTLTNEEYKKIQVYPTISDGVFNMANLQSEKIYHVQLINMLGEISNIQIIFHQGQTSLHFEDQKEGLYLLKLYCDNAIETIRIVII